MARKPCPLARKNRKLGGKAAGAETCKADPSWLMELLGALLEAYRSLKTKGSSKGSWVVQRLFLSHILDYFESSVNRLGNDEF